MKEVIKKVLILYFSGAGAAGKIAALIQCNLREKYTVELSPLEKAGQIDLNDFDAFIIGTPVYHAAPSLIVMDFFEAMPPLKNKTPAFIYNTRATWSCNTNRILAKKLKEKKILTIMDRDYRSPASDGSLIVPFIKRFHEFDRNIVSKVQTDCEAFIDKLEKAEAPHGYIPRFRMSSILNAPNKLAGQLATFPIHLHEDSCLRCGTCVKNCPHSARSINAEGYPAFNSENCENCYRCIHHCPAKALSLSKRRRPGRVLYSEN